MTTKPKLLIVEDDKNLGLLLNEYLIAKGYESTLAKDGEEGSNLFFQGKYDLCILDVMMPKKDGFSLAKEIRVVDKHTPILFLTARSLTEDAITGFRSGADDYITKPFNMEELLMRIEAVLRRTTGMQSKDNSDFETIKFGLFSFNTNTMKLSYLDKEEKLTPKEASLLHLFLKKKGAIVDRKMALKIIWNDDNYFNSRSMDVYIAKLRKRLKSDSSVQILTVHGEGFKLIY